MLIAGLIMVLAALWASHTHSQGWAWFSAFCGTIFFGAGEDMELADDLLLGRELVSDDGGCGM
jgi:hypothetical protein